MDANLLHDIIFYVMYAALAIALVIIIERTLYFAYTQRQARRLEQALTPEVRRAADLPDALTQ
ncbi:MotA/TolQ/ExbB proton channel family protein, partial [Serratia marcescens]